jgi:hypothetical protein
MKTKRQLDDFGQNRGLDSMTRDPGSSQAGGQHIGDGGTP